MGMLLRRHRERNEGVTKTDDVMPKVEKEGVAESPPKRRRKKEATE